jgi:DNA-binding transcriptional MerR regulator
MPPSTARDSRDSRPELLLTTNEVAAFADVSLRQLQWWDERDLLRPARAARGPNGFRRRRCWTAIEAAAARMVGELRRRNVKFAVIRKTIHVLMRNARAASRSNTLMVILKPRTFRAAGPPCALFLDRAKAIAAITRANAGAHLVEIIEPDVGDLIEQTMKRRAAAAGR